jgi:autotransporter-associated beta strand protein
VLLAWLPVRADDYWALLPSATGDWSKSANWSGGIPASGTNVYVVNGGTAVISVLGEACGNLTLGNTAGSGTIRMIGGGLSVPTGDDEYVGSTGAGTFTQTGGTNAISAAIDAQHLYHSLYVGYGTGSGTYNLSGSGLITTGGLVVSNNAPGAFTQSGGTVSVTYGTYVGNYATGTYSLSGSGLLSADTESIGWSGSGTFNQSGGQNVVRHLDLGDNDFSQGTYNLNGGTLHSTGGLFVGAIGSGSISQSGGANVASGGLTLGAFQGGSGTYNLNGGALVPSALGGGPGYFVFNFGGGTLQASGALSTTLPMTLSGNGSGATIDTAGYTMTLSGSLSGPGSLTKADSGTLTLAASNSYTGTTIIRAGTLSLANSAALVGGGSITFGGGTLQYTTSNSQDYSRKIIGSTGPVSIDTNGVNVTFASNLVGNNIGGLTKVGSGTLTLAVANAYGGNTWIGGGTLALGSPFALQNSTLDTSGTGTLSFGSLTAATLAGVTGPGTLALSNSASAAVALSVGNNNSSTAYSGTLQGPGSLTKIGSGILAMSGTNTYTGPTTVSQGKLTVDGWLTNSAVSVNGGTLGGTGYLGNVTVSASGTLAPGDPLGVLHLSGNLVLSAGAAMDFELDGVSTDDEVSMPSGTLTFSGQQFSNFGFAWTTGFGPGTYTLVNAETITGLGSNLSGSIDGLPATLSVSNNDLLLTVVPEPSTAALLGAGIVGLIGWVWQKRSRNSRVT